MTQETCCQKAVSENGYDDEEDRLTDWTRDDGGGRIGFVTQAGFTYRLLPASSQ